MLLPLLERLINLVMVPVKAFVHLIIDDPNPNLPVYLDVGAVLDELIERHMLTINR